MINVSCSVPLICPPCSSGHRSKDFSPLKGVRKQVKHHSGFVTYVAKTFYLHFLREKFLVSVRFGSRFLTRSYSVWGANEMKALLPVKVVLLKSWPFFLANKWIPLWTVCHEVAPSTCVPSAWFFYFYFCLIEPNQRFLWSVLVLVGRSIFFSCAPVVLQKILFFFRKWGLRETHTISIRVTRLFTKPNL